MDKCSTILLSLLLAAALGALCVFSFAPFEIFPLAILSLAGLLGLILNVSPKRAGWLGFSYGLGLFGAGIYWVYIAMHSHGDVPAIAAFAITVGLAAIMAIYPGMVCYLTNRFYPANISSKLILAFPALWLFGEFTRSWLGGGFPWLIIGYSQTNSPLKGFAPLLSVYGSSLAVLVTSGLLVNAILKYKQKNYPDLYKNILAIIALWIVGTGLSLVHWTHAIDKPITISLVQGNIPQSTKWSEEGVRLSFERYTTLTEPLWGKYNIIVWPEAAIPMTVQEANDFLVSMHQKARASNSTLILGIPEKNPNGAGYYNTILSLGNKMQTYAKRRLVPFGEYIPFQPYLAHLLEFMNAPMADMLPGKLRQPPLTVNDVSIDASICFEIAFPELINSRNNDIGVLLTVTNDAWYDTSIAQAQHLQMAEMRAIELGRPVIFSSNDGITALIDPQGNITAQAPTHVPYVLTGKVQPMRGKTLWMKVGIDLVLATLLYFLYLATKLNRQFTKMKK